MRHCIFIATLLCCTALFLKAEDSRVDCSQLLSVIGIDNNEKNVRHASVKKAAEQLKEVIGATSVQMAARNPECCFWVELFDRTGPGFILQIGPYGARLSAGDEASLLQGVAHIKKLAKKDGSKITLPLGVWSSFPTTLVKP